MVSQEVTPALKLVEMTVNLQPLDKPVFFSVLLLNKNLQLHHILLMDQAVGRRKPEGRGRG